MARNTKAAALLLALAGVGASADAGALDALRARGALRVLFSSDENPLWFSGRSDGEPGFERDVLEGFARTQKLRLEVVPVVAWENAIPDLVKGRGDVLAGVAATDARRKLVDFSDELLPARQLVVTRRPRSAVKDLAQLRAERVAVAPDTSWWDAVVAAGVPSAQIVSASDQPSALEALRSERATAAVMSVVDFLFERRKDPALEAGLTLGPPVSSAWGVRKADTDLRQALNAYLDGLHKSPAWSRLIVKYFGEDALVVLGRATAK